MVLLRNYKAEYDMISFTKVDRSFGEGLLTHHNAASAKIPESTPEMLLTICLS